jgi:hypothetical protein
LLVENKIDLKKGCLSRNPHEAQFHLKSQKLKLYNNRKVAKIGLLEAKLKEL